MIVGFSLLAFFLAGIKVALLVGLALVLVAALFVYRGGIFTFIAEVRVELGKCSWPWDPNQTGFKKYKELIAIAVALTTQCPYCLEVHRAAAEAVGATQEELAETALVAAALRAGAAVTHATHVIGGAHAAKPAE